MVSVHASSYKNYKFQYQICFLYTIRVLIVFCLCSSSKINDLFFSVDILLKINPILYNFLYNFQVFVTHISCSSCEATLTANCEAT